MRDIWKAYLAYAAMFAAIWLIWWMGICDGITLEIAGRATGQGTHILTVAGPDVTGNCLNWTITGGI